MLPGFFHKQHEEPSQVQSDTLIEATWNELKNELMADILGKEYTYVTQSLLPYRQGGLLNLYYFPNSIKGTGIATKELASSVFDSASNSVYEKYELVAFTRQRVELSQSRNRQHPFGYMHQRIQSFLNPIADFALNAKLEPMQVCQLPDDTQGAEGACLVFENYDKIPGKPQQRFGMMLVMEIFPEEMDYALKHGTRHLIEKLKNANHYPYSDLNRESVV